jgi:tRNA threonylcarbamoyladenosine biosynthesis protein TsaE
MAYQSFSLANTKALGRRVAEALVRRGAGRRATVIALRGDLGSGKTTFTQGFFVGFGSRARAVSPTFILMRRTPVRRGGFRNLIHIDAYRLRSPDDLMALEWKKLCADPANVLVIEWADRIRQLLPRSATRISFRHGKREHGRIIHLSNNQSLISKS